MPFMRVQRRGFISTGHLRKEIRSLPIFLVLSPTRHLFLPQTTARLDYVIPPARRSSLFSLPVLSLFSSVPLLSQQQPHLGGLVQKPKKVYLFSNWKIPSLPRHSPADTGCHGRRTELCPHWLYHLQQVTAPLGLGFSPVKSTFFLEFLQKLNKKTQVKYPAIYMNSTTDSFLSVLQY